MVATVKTLSMEYYVNFKDIRLQFNLVVAQSSPRCIINANRAARVLLKAMTFSVGVNIVCLFAIYLTNH